MAKLMSINIFFLVWTYLFCSKIHFWFNDTKVFVVNWLKLHYKLQHLFSGALYNQSKCKKCAVPLANCSSADWLLARPQLTIDFEGWMLGVVLFSSLFCPSPCQLKVPFSMTSHDIKSTRLISRGRLFFRKFC